MAPIRDQGQRGTCVAFAVTAAHEVGRSDGAAPEDLSEEALHWGCKQIDGNWDSGTTFGSASPALARWGQPLEMVWPYDATRADGVAYASPRGQGGAGWFRSGLRRVPATLSDVRTYLNGGTPVLLRLTVFDTFLQPDPSGRVADPPTGASARGFHAVLAVGHQGQELLIRNSWGTTWAIGGYAWISDGYIDAHADQAWILDATVNTAGTPGGTSTNPPDGETHGTR